jgi:hypothetical protein
MRAMRAIILPLLALASPAAAAGPWLDWGGLNNRAMAGEAEARAFRNPADARSEAEARALGARVGRMVAAGDCTGGEKMARAAGDVELAAAVRKYCLGS